MGGLPVLGRPCRPAARRRDHLPLRAGSVHRLGVFNGDPHLGNYRFLADGRIAFLDFGLVKRWTPGEWERLVPCLEAILDVDPDRLLVAMEDVEFLTPGHGLDAQAVFDYVSLPYRPLPHRPVRLQPRVRGRDGAAHRRRPRPARRGRREAQPPGQLRHPGPGRVCPLFSASSRRRDRGGASSTSTGRGALLHPARRAGRRLALDRLSSATKWGAAWRDEEGSRERWLIRTRPGRRSHRGTARVARAVRRRGVGAPGRQLQVG